MSDGGTVPGQGASVPESRFVEVLDADGRTRWRVDRGFLESNWRCIWGMGCQGIEDEPAPELHRGCCSVGARLADEQEAMTAGVEQGGRGGHRGRQLLPGLGHGEGREHDGGDNAVG